jgi:hypothetical protein
LQLCVGDLACPPHVSGAPENLPVDQVAQDTLECLVLV